MDTHNHRMERTIQRYLLSQPQLNFSSLSIHRTRAGICLRGTVRTHCSAAEVTSLVQSATGLPEVLNHLVMHDIQPHCDN